MTAFIEEHRARFGVVPICRTLGVSASAYYQRRSGHRSARRVEDERLTERIRQLHRANFECYGYRRVHAALVREGEAAGRDRVARLMGQDGLQGAKRGKPWRTTIPYPVAPRPADLVERNFAAEANPGLRRTQGSSAAAAPTLPSYTAPTPAGHARSKDAASPNCSPPNTRALPTLDRQRPPAGAN